MILTRRKISAANEEQKEECETGKKKLRVMQLIRGDEIQSDEDYVPSSGSDEESDGDDGERSYGSSGCH